MPNFGTELIFNSPALTQDTKRIRQRRNNFGVKAAPRPVNKRFSMQGQFLSENNNLLKTLFKKNTLNNGAITDSRGGLGLPHLVKRDRPLNLSDSSNRVSTLSRASKNHSGSSCFGSRKGFIGSGSSMWSQLSGTLTLKQKISRQQLRAKKRFKKNFKRKMKLSFGLKGRRLRADSKLRLRNFGRNMSLNALVSRRLRPDPRCFAIESYCPIDVMKATAMWNAKLKREHRELLKARKEAREDCKSGPPAKRLVFLF